MTARRWSGLLLNLAVVFGGVLAITYVWPEPTGLRALAAGVYGGVVSLLIGTVWPR